MDMENEASWAMDQLRAANKASDEGKFLAKQQQQYVSQFRIDGQPILPPLMTADRRQQMWQLKQRALQLEAKYKQQAQCTDTSISSNTSSMSTVQRILPQQQQRLQQTPTYIYDSTQQDVLLETPRSRPQTLQLKSGSSNSSNNSCGSNTNCGIPSICVNPPTPLEPNPSLSLSLSPNANASRLQLGHTRRKLNNITSRIMRFERQADNEALPLQVLWQDKRMLRSSTSPALLLPQPEASGQQMQRSRSFTLDEPSPALLAHMQRVGQQQMEQEQQQQQQQQQVATTVTATSPRNPRLVHATQSLAHLRRDTIESKAKQVQRSASGSLVSATTTTSRRCGGNSPQRSLQQQQQYLKQLLQRALHEADDVCDEQSQQERKHLTLAKRQMFKDIKLAHRDRFQQLVQYQHEEQRRMQAEFDRQQKFLIEQICADINVAVYANESTSPQATTASASSLAAAPTSSASACTSTADLSPNCTSTARKRLFDGADTESDVPSEMLPLDSVATTKSQPSPNHNNTNNSNSSESNKSKLKKSQQLQQQRKLSSPVTKTPPARRVINKTTTSSVGRTKPQQQQQQQQTTTTTTSLSKTRRAASPSRQSQRFVAKK